MYPIRISIDIDNTYGLSMSYSTEHLEMKPRSSCWDDYHWYAEFETAGARSEAISEIGDLNYHEEVTETLKEYGAVNIKTDYDDDDDE